MTELTDPASILILAETSDRWFSSPESLAELLHLEGMNDLETARLEDLTGALLEGRSLVLLGPADPSPLAVDLLLGFVERGGGLVCCAPGEALAARLGLRHLLRGTLHPRVTLTPGAFADDRLQVRGWAQHYAPATGTSADVLAQLYDAQGLPLEAPAALELHRGRGTIIVIAYDLAASTFLLRQGDPLLAGTRSTAYERMRPLDLFKPWLDPRDTLQPSADLQCHFLRELVQRAWPAGTVLPWLWYFPDNAETMIVMTSDDDWSTREQFEQLIAACDQHDARLTFYLVERKSVMNRRWLEDLSQRGFDFSIHPDLPPPSGALWDERLARHMRQFTDTYGRPPSPSVRNHCITWSGYIDGARAEAKHGFTFDANYFSMDGYHYMAGGGLPLAFADPFGSMLPIFQLPTQFSDETTLGRQGFPWSLNLTPDQGIEHISGLIRRNASEQHSMLCLNAHPVSFATYSAPLWEPLMAFAHQSHIPIWPVDRFGTFWHTRRQTRLRPIPEELADLPDLHLSLPTGQTAMIPTTIAGLEHATSFRRVNSRLYRTMS
jgi:hypothetical protein